MNSIKFYIVQNNKIELHCFFTSISLKPFCLFSPKELEIRLPSAFNFSRTLEVTM